MLTTAANNALTQNVNVPAGIEATAHDGNVELIGEVRYGSDRVAAERAVAELAGVRNIKDYIDIIPDVDPTHVLFLVQGVLDRYAVVDDDKQRGRDHQRHHGHAFAPGPSTTQWSTLPGWPPASSTSTTNSPSPGDLSAAGRLCPKVLLGRRVGGASHATAGRLGLCRERGGLQSRCSGRSRKRPGATRS